VSDARAFAAPLAVLAAVVAGVIAGERLGPAPAVLACASGLALVTIAAVARGTRGLACLVLAAALLGTGATRRALHGLVDTPLASLASQHAAVDASLTFVDDPDPGRFTTRAIARVRTLTAAERVAGGRRLVVVTGSSDVGSRLAVLEAGDRVTVRGHLRPLVGYDARFRWRHAVARLAVTDVMSVEHPDTPLARVANLARHAVLGGTRLLPAKERGLVGGFLLGGTRGVPPAIVDEFRASGLSHLLAVSGENVAFVLAIVGPVLRRFGLRGRFLAGIAVLVLFGAMTRWEPSVLRATAMAGLSMTAVLLGRPVPAARVLALVATALVLADPFLLHSVGFLLSCGACAGLVLVAPVLDRRLPGPDVMRLPLATTAAAQLGVLPVAIATFGSLPLVALPANLAVAAVIGPLTVAGLLGGAVGGLLAGRAPSVAALCLAPSRVLTDYVELVARVASRVPVPLDARTTWLVVALVCALGATLVARRARAGSVAAR
jgi:competence protein ComEC